MKNIKTQTNELTCTHVLMDYWVATVGATNGFKQHTYIE